MCEFAIKLYVLLDSITEHTFFKVKDKNFSLI
ncbi:hypothetical protein HH_1073 [Helicobacter hepaticus ATCC 51449]|uniref:Uncharacterized protein n=1 Tax=Helicobacter hepaticus (strain ATCC 51449 / 3B1) TaxID=235279 RepID=Q7VH94_HELHP|nr:hypothetical protein HH_1073 [Helicobacter hepaticus ATCC 51449]